MTNVRENNKRGRPRFCTEAFAKSIFSDRTYRSTVGMLKFGYVANALYQACEETVLGNHAASRTRWPWLLRETRTQRTVLAELCPLPPESIVEACDQIENLRRVGTLANAKEARQYARDMKTVIVAELDLK